MNDNHDLEGRLRASLQAHARRAPAGDSLAEQIIADAERSTPDRSSRRSWRVWMFPLVSAGAVAAVAAALVGINQVSHGARHQAPIPPAASGVTTPAPTMTAKPTASATATSSPAPTGPAVPLTQFQAIDVTFVGPSDGWALGTAACLSDPSTRCAAIAHTADGGTSWQSMKQPAGADVPGSRGCRERCIDSIRFATDRIGYAFGPAALYMTTDGGASWVQQPGGADALETLDGNVIRVSAGNGCSPPGCTYAVQTALIGSDHWRTGSLGAYSAGMSTGVALDRTGHSAYLEVFGHPTGGASNATSTLYTSTDDGQSWTNRGEPCPYLGAGHENDSVAIAAAADGSVTVDCAVRGSPFATTVTSTDGGRNFVSPPRPGTLAPAAAIGAASRTVLLVANGAKLFRSDDAGDSWTAVLDLDVGAGASWIGFESTTTGRVLSASGGTIWTTHDAGVTWTPQTFA
jgi:hypothetical protein